MTPLHDLEPMSTTTPPLSLEGAIWLSADGEKLGGSARMALLAQLAQSGSITQAAKAVGMSYKGAWDAIDTMNNLAGEPLVERAAGGKGGGGTRLTPRGQQLVHNFQVIEQAHQAFVQQLAQQAQHLTQDYLLLKHLAVKTSARNQFLGTVTEVKRGAVNDEVSLKLASGHALTAIVTHDSALSLGLTPGVKAFALVKSSSIILMPADTPVQLSARNQLRGVVARVQDGAVNTEVIIDLGEGLSVAAIVTSESCQNLAIVVGQPMTALFKASSVIVGVPA